MAKFARKKRIGCQGAEAVLEYRHVQARANNTRFATDSSACSWLSSDQGAIDKAFQYK
ncbi:MAG: hypothetical protein QGG20_06195 [Dehalococcoidia bacterium]|jgi:hypothetical protein|nr:hypothetical protein [Dehalococcoidia bacterium]